MGHNVSLNSPATFHYGGRIDGSANAIFSETMAQIFAHATSYRIINDYTAFGIESALSKEIELSARASIQGVRNSYDQFVAAGAPFTSWNDPVTPHDETFGTFMTLAFKFFEQAELAENGYEQPLMRMMKMLQLFDEDMAANYAQHSNTVETETYRSTLMVAALSYAFETDLRDEMRALNFPVDDQIHQHLIREATECIVDLSLNCPLSGDPQSYIDGFNVQLNGGIYIPFSCPEVERIEWDWGDGEIIDSAFPATHIYSAPGKFSISIKAMDDNSSILAEDSCQVTISEIDLIFRDGFEFSSISEDEFIQLAHEFSAN